MIQKRLNEIKRDSLIYFLCSSNCTNYGVVLAIAFGILNSVAALIEQIPRVNLPDR